MATNPVLSLLESVRAAEAQALVEARSSMTDINEQLTVGPVENNLSGDYKAGSGAWDIHFNDKINSDLLLIMQSRMGQMYLKLNQPNRTPVIPRKVKDLLIRDYFPVHTVRNLGREVTS